MKPAMTMTIILMMTMVIGVLSLPDFGLTKKAIISGFYGNCSAGLDFCLKPGATCSQSVKSSQCDRSNSSVANCCPDFEKCGRNSTCVQDNIGDNCTLASDCYNLGAATVFACDATSASGKSFCRVQYGAGDGCVTNADCISPLSCNTANKTCQGQALGQTCGQSSLLQSCGVGLYCDILKNMTCQLTLAAGATTCTSPSLGGIPCAAGSYCDGKNCQVLGSVKNGGACNFNPYLCTSGSTCTNNPTNNTCVTGQTQTITTCTNNSDCSSIKYTVAGKASNSSCVCTSSGKGVCQTNAVQYPVAGIAEGTNLANCMAKYNCGYYYALPVPFAFASDLPASCVVKNCNSDYKKFMAQDCSNVKLEGSCKYNPFCSGFPIWAIIVIVVVAILLVLAVVFVIFLVLRKRRDYSSI